MPNTLLLPQPRILFRISRILLLTSHSKRVLQEPGPQPQQKQVPSHWQPPPHFVTFSLPSHNPPNTQTIPTVCTTKDLGTVLNTKLSAEDNVVSAANKASTMQYYLKQTFAPLTPSIFLPLYEKFTRSHLKYAVQASSPILSRDCQALESVQKLVLKGLRHVPYETALQRLRLFFP